MTAGVYPRRDHDYTAQALRQARERSTSAW